MFCYQCEQAAKGTGCESLGVCGKSPEVTALQDALIHQLLQIGTLAHTLKTVHPVSEEIALFTLQGLFITVTNVHFDPERMLQTLEKSSAVKRELLSLLKDSPANTLPANLAGCPDKHQEPRSPEEWLHLGEKVSPKADIEKYGEDLGGLKWLAIYGLKGTAAYAEHAWILGYKDDEVNTFFFEALHALAQEDLTVEALLALNLRIGAVNLRVMELLDAANTETYGHPEPTQVRVTPVKGKAILVSGHDLYDLERLLKQTEGKGIHVYTHGEMLPCNAYPGLKKYPHLIGNYGGAWQDQQKEFAAFPGAILMTTNCIQKPGELYSDRIFTSGLVAWPGVTHIADGDFSPVILAAEKAAGFVDDAPEKRITIGFARNAVLAAAEKVVELVQDGKIRHFFLVGGCDGAKAGRNYYTEFAEKAPKDTLILTLACGKFRFNKLEFGDIEGIPRLLDCGQCNDAYSAIQIALALSKAFDTDVNSLPLSLILSWYEQKAVCILLTLLHLGIKNIHIGPSLPAFIGPAVLEVLVDQFGLKPISTADNDLKNILG